MLPLMWTVVAVSVSEVVQSLDSLDEPCVCSTNSFNPLDDEQRAEPAAEPAGNDKDALRKGLLEFYGGKVVLMRIKDPRQAEKASHRGASTLSLRDRDREVEFAQKENEAHVIGSSIMAECC